ncbi:hypothetical protein NPIL_638341 [Nephila pilipes]|uniref:Uncharacterized protein n=1 Tax=Nephila pilipes TaxID=299642 RepID=A0A8X6QGF4_NEPPI|nr:hypothetical protein NPIL_638341 [Nephila pilipes]
MGMNNSKKKLFVVSEVFDVEALAFAEHMSLIVMPRLDVPFQTSFEKSDHYRRYFLNLEKDIEDNLETHLSSWYELLESNPKLWVVSEESFKRFLDPFSEQFKTVSSSDLFLSLCTKLLMAAALFHNRGVVSAPRLARILISSFISKRFKFGVIIN